MFRLFLRDALGAGVLLALLGTTAVVLGVPAVAPSPAAPWSSELARIGADPILLARDGALLLLALAALCGSLGALGSGLRLLGRDYPALAHLTEALASRLARRAGALVGVALTILQSGGLARAAGLSRQAVASPSTPHAALVHQPHTPPRPAPPTPAPRATAHQRATHPGVRRPVRRVGLALRYTVQPDDTMDDVAARFGLPDWRPIMRATRGLPQPVAGPITDPNRIWPGQVLLIPLPCPALRLAGEHVLYVVQQGDYLSAIAARFLGDWRAYPAIAALNRGVHQLDGGALENDNLIQPGWVLRLPQVYVVTRPDGTIVTHRVVVDHVRPIRPRRGLHPRRRAAHTGAAPIPLQRERPSLGRHHTAITPPGRPRAHPRHHKGLRLRPRPVHPARTRQPHHAPPTHRHPVRRRPALHPVPAGGPHAVPHRRGSGQHGAGRTRQRLVPRRGAPRRVRTIGSPAPRPLRQPSVAPPLVHVPDLGRDLPAAFVLGFLALATAVAAARRRARRCTPAGTQAGPPRGGRFGALAPSVQTALRAALDGVEGSLVRALRRTRAATTGGARAAHVVAALECVGREAGVPYSLAGATRLLIEGAQELEVIIAATRLRAPQSVDIARRLGAALGVPVTATGSMERDGTPLLTLTIKAAALAAPAEVRPHPAPLLVPVGATTEGAVVHLNLARTGGLLVAGGGQSLVATLLAGAVYQAPPEVLRLLVASDDDELRKALPQLDHLEAPPADARDPRAVATLIAQAHTLVLDRYERYGAAVTAPPGTSQASPVPCLLLLAGIEGLDDATLDRLDAVAHTGPVCGVHLLATAGDPATLAASGMLALFRTRLARRLAPAANALICPDADAGTLGPHEVVLSGLGPARRLRAFTLTPPEVRELCATVAAATVPALPPAPPTPAPGPPPVPAPAPPSPVAPALPVDAAAGPGTPAAPQVPASVVGTGEGMGAGAGEDSGTPTVRSGEVPQAEEDVEEDDADEGVATAAASTPTATAAGPPVRLDLLGGTLVFVQDRPITILPRERSLLAALAVLGPRPVPRGDLIEALFADDADGSNTLSHALADLRAALRDAGLPRDQARDLVRRSSGGYLLNERLVAVDLWRFDALLREAEGRDEGEAGPLLAEAFALYHGPLCGGEALGFVEEQGYRWLRRAPSALYRLADSYREAGDAKAALHWTRRLLADEPCDDHAHQLALNLLAELGDADGLDTHLAEMRERYKADKQKIDPYTLRLYEQLRRKLRGASESKAG